MKKRKKKIINLLIIIFTIIFLSTTSLIIYNNILDEKIADENNKVNSILIKDGTNKELIKNLRTEFNNQEIIGVLKISDIINVPITQTSNNTYYLKYGLNKTKIRGGSPFLDYRTKLEDKQINIYGHNSTRYDLPFEKLENYLNNDYTNDNDIIEFETLDKTYKYIITYVYMDMKKSSAEHYNYEYANDEDWLNHVKVMKDKAFYSKEFDITEYDKILILQTCLFGENENKFLIIVAKQLN